MGRTPRAQPVQAMAHRLSCRSECYLIKSIAVFRKPSRLKDDLNVSEPSADHPSSKGKKKLMTAAFSESPHHPSPPVEQGGEDRNE